MCVWGLMHGKALRSACHPAPPEDSTPPLRVARVSREGDLHVVAGWTRPAPSASDTLRGLCGGSQESWPPPAAPRPQATCGGGPPPAPPAARPGPGGTLTALSHCG